MASCLFLLGCGGSESANTTTATRHAAKRVERPPTLESKVVHYISHRFKDARWYPLITHIRVEKNTSVTVETKLTNRKIRGRNKKTAGVMCKAFLTSPRIKVAYIFYDEGPYNEVFSC